MRNPTVLGRARIFSEDGRKIRFVGVKKQPPENLREIAFDFVLLLFFVTLVSASLAIRCDDDVIHRFACGNER